MTGVVADAIVLTGGRARRLGGVDKGAVVVAGATLLAHTIAALREVESSHIVVVGPAAGVDDTVTVVRENPPFAGPVAGIARGVGELRRESEWTYVVACDMPWIGEGLTLLTNAIDDDHDGAIGIDHGGVHQPLLGLYRTEVLRSALSAIGDPVGLPVRELVKGWRLHRVPVGRAAHDADTWKDVKQLEEELR